jgi:hypothetical protein
MSVYAQRRHYIRVVPDTMPIVLIENLSSSREPLVMCFSVHLSFLSIYIFPLYPFFDIPVLVF